ncbi:MAG: outer membrane protein transport protein [Oceanospirillaceae bacterium]|nr:outer membrane protein transport protein [Oceanospirillaceae bacterium]MCP5335954.1 outer membrane protein transport protein [Oceanospirillaceae bacterium]MCP5349953.1 outer membrane protein transport protein [Oceanospirillaceae bacterium]
MISKKTVLRSAIIAASVAPALALASGYKINEQSASGVGTAYAGRAAVAEDASVVFYNPAAMTEFKRAELTVGATYIDVTGELSNSSKQNPANYSDSQEASLYQYSEGGDYIPNPTIPFAYYVRPLNDKMAVGLGVFVPFGTNTNYKSDSIVGGFADETMLKVIDIQPSFAYKLNDEISVGGGIDIVYAQALLSKQLDLIPFPVQDGSGNFYPGYENKYSVEGDDWAYGWNLAMFWKLSDKTTFGATYRSQIDIEFTGDSEFTSADGVYIYVPGSGVAPVGVAGDTPSYSTHVDKQSSRVPLSTPQSVTLSVAHQLTDALQLQAGATWTDWSVFQNLDIIATESGIIDNLGGLNDSNDGKYIGHIEENWKDTIAYALGGTYTLNDQWLVRAGYAYDDAAVTVENRTARVPDNDRQWLTTGFRFTATQDISVDVGAAYLLFHPAKLNERDNNLDGSQKGAQTVQGDYDVDAFALSMQLNYKM